MGADKNSLRRELGLCPEITSKRPPQVLSRSRSNQCATDPRNNTATQVLETRSGKQPEHSKPSGRSDQPRGAVRPPGSKSQHRSDRSPAPVRPVKGQVTRPTHTGSPGRYQRQTGSPLPQHWVTRPTLVISPRNHCTGQTGVGHRSDRSLTTLPKLIQNLPSRPRWKSQAVDQIRTSQTRS